MNRKASWLRSLRTAGVAIATTAVAVIVMPTAAHATYISQCTSAATRIDAANGPWCFAGSGKIPVNLSNAVYISAGDRGVALYYSDGSIQFVDRGLTSCVSVHRNLCEAKSVVSINRF
ncbi:hypothetical protein ACLQ24_00970 [Micromonospora sp. DT4]|uniref:hypothetical protein n=1 Tax=Micromonospora sp. DT4 TaxID=3393438 RepID=UPI003CF9AD4A